MQSQIFGEAMHILRQDVAWTEAGCCLQMRQDVAAHVSTHKNIVSLLAESQPGCRQTASHRPAKRRCKQESGRRGSNPRQPAWKAVTYKNTARLLYISQRSHCIQSLKKVCSKEAGTHRFGPTINLTKRQVLNTSEEIIAYEDMGNQQENQRLIKE
jgi:hypothetical protein